MTELSAIKEIPVFAAIDDNCAAAIAAAASRRGLAAGEVLFKEGSPGTDVFFVLSGAVAIEKSIAIDKFKTLAVLGGGEFFGEMAVLSDDTGPRSARAVALADSVLAGIQGEKLLEILHGSPKSGMAALRAMLQAVSGRLRKTSAELAMVYDISALAFAEFEDEKAFAARLLNEAMPYLEGGWSAGFYIYDRFNEELSVSALTGENFTPPRDLAQIRDNIPNFWHGDRAYTVILPGKKRPDGFMVFAAPGPLPEQDRRALAVALSTLGCLANSMLDNIRYNRENKMRDMLMRRKYQRG
ncbi:MAG: cyclic nucleotide-binding domain-containing protein [Elusimicrobiales bacterium]